MKNYRQMDLLSWFVHAWFLGQAFDERHRRRALFHWMKHFVHPLYIPFVTFGQAFDQAKNNIEIQSKEQAYSAFMKALGERRFPLFLSAAVRERIRRAHASKQLNTPSPPIAWAGTRITVCVVSLG